MIRRNNYEQFAVDYLEGNLTAEQQSAMELFLQQNPDIAQELDAIVWTSLPLEEDHLLPTFQNKDDLKHQLIRWDNYEQYALDYVEQQLPPAMLAEMQTFLAKNPIIEQQLQHFQCHTLLADLSQTYPHKEQLKRRKKELFYLPILRYSAAALLLLALMWQMMQINIDQNTPNKPAVADQLPNKIDIPVTTTTKPNNNTTNSTLVVTNNKHKGNDKKTLFNNSTIANNTIQRKIVHDASRQYHNMAANNTKQTMDLVQAPSMTSNKIAPTAIATSTRVAPPPTLTTQPVAQIVNTQHPVFYISHLPFNRLDPEDLLPPTRSALAKRSIQQFLSHVPHELLPETLVNNNPRRTTPNISVDIPVDSDTYHFLKKQFK